MPWTDIYNPLLGRGVYYACHDVVLRVGALHTPINTSLTIAFDENLDTRSISLSALRVVGEQSDPHRGLLQVRGAEIQFVPDRVFADGETVTVTLATGVADSIGNPTPEAFSWRFSTGLGVWPGDTDNSGLVDAFDIVPIGKYWKHTGRPRDSSSTEWEGQPAVPFSIQAATYADTDGNGLIESDDVIPIALNWNRSRETQAAPQRINEGFSPLGRSGTLGRRPEGSQRESNQRIDNMQYALRISDTDVEGVLAIYREIYAKLLTLPADHEGVIALRTVIARQIAQLESRLIPTQTQLLPNYPNPFNPETWIPYQLTEAGKVTIEIYDLRGRLVRTLNLGHQQRGYYVEKNRAAHWDGRNRFGEHVASGEYIYRLKIGSFSATRRLAVIK